MDSSCSDNDWGTGSFYLSDVIHQCRDMNDYCEDEGDGTRPYYIAVIEDDCCIQELDENGIER